MFFSSTLSLLLCAATLGAADGGSVLTKPPTLVRDVKAVFPAEAVDGGTGAVVELELDLSATGTVDQARVVSAAAPPFDEAALVAARQLVFTPAEVDGQPASVRIRYSVRFFWHPPPLPTGPVPETSTDSPKLTEFAGTLLERGTRVPVEGALVTARSGETTWEAYSNTLGEFSFPSLPVGEVAMTASRTGYSSFQTSERLNVGEKTVATYYVRKSQYGAYETSVRGVKEKKNVAQVSLQQEEIRLIPGTQGDAFKVVQNLPGVARTPFGIGFLIVRGSKPWDTRTYVDQSLIPLLFHFGGLKATYNSELLQDLSFSAGNFSVPYGRSIGGLVAATTRAPSNNGFHGYVDVSVLDASFLVETPLWGGWSVAAAARRSYIDVTLPAALRLFAPAAADAVNFTVAPRYYDYQLKLEYQPVQKNGKFFISLFGSDDALRLALPNPSIDPEGRGDFGTAINYHRLTVGYERQLNPRTRFSSYSFVGRDSSRFSFGSDVYFQVYNTPVATRNTLDVTLPSANLSMQVGLDFLFNPWVVDVQGPPLARPNQIPDPVASRQLRTDRTTSFFFEPAVFLDATWKPLPDLRVNAGLRADYQSYMNKGWVDPRLGVFYTFAERFTAKAGFGLYHQPPDYRTGNLSAAFGNPDLKPEGAHHGMVGLDVKLTDALSLETQLYYKNLFDQARQTLAQTPSSAPVPPYQSIGRGRAYGAELLLRHQLTKRFFGWIAYSLSRSERDFVGGTQYSTSQFDQPHNLIVVASYKFPYDFIGGVRLRYASGALETPVTGALYDVNGNYYYPISGLPYSRRLPSFFQLDVRIDKRFVFERWMFAIYLDIQNATNAGNVEALVYNYNYTQERFLYGLPIIPALGIRGEW